MTFIMPSLTEDKCYMGFNPQRKCQTLFRNVRNDQKTIRYYLCGTLMRVKEKSKKTGLNSTFKKAKIMASGPIVLGMHAQSLQWCPNLCNPMDYSPPTSSVHGISQARILEWVAMPSSRGSSWPKDWTSVSSVACTAGRFFTAKPLGKPFGPIISWQTEGKSGSSDSVWGHKELGRTLRLNNCGTL